MGRTNIKQKENEMGLFNFTRREKRSEEMSGEVLLKQMLRTEALTVEQALAIPGLSGSVNFIADKIAQLPIRLFERTENGVLEITDDHRLYLLNVDTGDTMTPYTMKQAVIRNYFLDNKGGNIYIERADNGEVAALRYVDPMYISLLHNQKPIHREYTIEVTGEGSFYPFDFVRLIRHSADGITGESVVDENRGVLNAGYSLLKYMQYLMRTGGTKRGFLKSNRKLTDEVMEKIRTAWARLYSVDGENNVMLLNDGIDYTPAQATSVELQLTENQNTVEKGICMLFKLSPDIISGNCSYEQRFSSLESAVVPILQEFEDALNRDLLTEREKGVLFFAFDTRELCRADIVTRYNAYSIGLQNSFLQLNDVRRAEHMAPLNGMDNLIRLTLNDVLYDVKNGTVFNINSSTVSSLNDTAEPEKNEGKEEGQSEN